MVLKIEKPIALFDMDGTVADYDGAMLRDLEKLRSPNEVEITNIRTAERQPHIKERMSMIKRQPGWWENLEPLPLGMKIYKYLSHLDFKIHILTQGPANTTSAWTEKVKWCNANLSTSDITITRDKSLVYGKILVDDFSDYAFAWLKNRPRGLVLMPENSGNNDIKHPNIFLCNERNIEEAFMKCRIVADKFFAEESQLD